MLSNDVLLWCLIALIALALGAVAAWLLARPRVRDARADGHASRDAEVAQLLAERAAVLEAAQRWKQDHANVARDLDTHRQQVLALGGECAKLTGRLERLAQAESELAESRAEAMRRREAQHRAEQRSAELETQLREHAQAADEKIALLSALRQDMTDRFKLLAAAEFDTASKKITEQNQLNLGTLLDPLRSQLGEFQKLVSESNLSGVARHTELASSLKQLFELNHRLGDEAHNLTRALKNDSRSQGAWGEMILERLLEMAGLQAGRQYETQGSFLAEDGSRQRPDVIVHLPEEKDIIVDAKVSLVGWDRYTAALTDEERALGLRDLKVSIRRHIDGLSGKDYSSLPGLRTLDFVLLFIPIEAAFAEALRDDDKLYEYAMSRKISLVSPSTLLIALQTVGHLWKMAQRNVNALEFAKVAAQLHDNFVLLVEGIQDVGEKLGRARGAHDGLLRRLTEGGKGSVILQVQKLKDLGAQTRKTLPRSLLDSAGASDEMDALADTDSEAPASESLRLKANEDLALPDGESPGG